MALRGSQLLGKTLGVIGLGAIGGRLVELCVPFGMEVLAWSARGDEAHVRPNTAFAIDCSGVSFATGRKNCSSDWITSAN